MIFKFIKSVFPTPNGQITHFFRTKQGFSSFKSFLKNDNLMFEDDNSKMTTYFFLPQIKKTQNNSYQINKDSNVLSLVWQARDKDAVKVSEESNKKFKQNESKVSFSFKYHQLQQLLQVRPKSGLRVTIERKRKIVHQYLTLAENPVNKTIQFLLKNLDVSEQGKVSGGKELCFGFAYSKYRIFSILLKKSLFELSGMGMMYQLKRDQELDSPQNSLRKKKEEIQKEVQEFYK